MNLNFYRPCNTSIIDSFVFKVEWINQQQLVKTVITYYTICCKAIKIIAKVFIGKSIVRIGSMDPIGFKYFFINTCIAIDYHILVSRSWYLYLPINIIQVTSLTVFAMNSFLIFVTLVFGNIISILKVLEEDY